MSGVSPSGSVPPGGSQARQNMAPPNAAAPTSWTQSVINGVSTFGRSCWEAVKISFHYAMDFIVSNGVSQWVASTRFAQWITDHCRTFGAWLAKIYEQLMIGLNRKQIDEILRAFAEARQSDQEIQEQLSRLPAAARAQCHRELDDYIAHSQANSLAMRDIAQRSMEQTIQFAQSVDRQRAVSSASPLQRGLTTPASNANSSGSSPEAGPSRLSSASTTPEIAEQDELLKDKEQRCEQLRKAYEQLRIEVQEMQMRKDPKQKQKAPAPF